MKLEDAIKLGLGLKGIITHASTVTMQEALTTMATELELQRTQEPVAVVERVHGQMCLQFVWGKTIYDMPVGMKLYAHPMVAADCIAELKQKLDDSQSTVRASSRKIAVYSDQLKVKDDLIASLEAQYKDLEQKLAAQANMQVVDDKPKQTSRYDWSKAPAWAMWAATDDNGQAWYYNEKPREHPTGWVIPFKHGAQAARCWNLNVSAIADWRNSLEQRPKPVGVELVNTKLPPVAAPIEKPKEYITVNNHEIHLGDVRAVSFPTEQGCYSVVINGGITFPCNANNQPRADIVVAWKAYREAN